MPLQTCACIIVAFADRTKPSYRLALIGVLLSSVCVGHGVRPLATYISIAVVVDCWGLVYTVDALLLIFSVIYV